MSETIALARSGTQFIEALPKGSWRLFPLHIDGHETVVALSPEHPARFYRNGKKVDIIWP